MYPYANPNILAQSINLLKSVNWSALLDGTGKTLGVINQAIPVFYQVKPIWNNAKTMIRVFKGVNSSNNDVSSTTNTNKALEPNNNQNNAPTFFA